MSARLAARAGPFLALLVLLLFLPEGAAAYNVPYRDYYDWCYWSELRDTPGGRINYDMSESVEGWWKGVENWDVALRGSMYFDNTSYPNGKTHLRWEGQPPSYEYCVDWAYACFKVENCSDSQMIEATVYFDSSAWASMIDEDRIASSGHEWGHTLNLGDYDPPRYFCEWPYRIMGWPDGVGCITSPSCAERAAVIDFYMLLPWWHDRDGDCWDNGDEDFIGTDDWDDCPDGSWDDAWPPDIDNDTEVDIVDVLKFKDHIMTGCGDPDYWQRLDLDADCDIDIVDVLKLKPYMLRWCTNP